LLLVADGFEGLFTCPIHLHSDRATTAQRPHHCEVLVNFDAADLASPPVMDHHDHSVSSVDYLLGFHVLRGEAFFPGFDKVAELRGPGVGGGVWQLHPRHVPHNVGVDQVLVLHKAALVVDVEKLSDKSNVLLRHRPRSIAQLCGLTPGPEDWRSAGLRQGLGEESTELFKERLQQVAFVTRLFEPLGLWRDVAGGIWPLAVRQRIATPKRKGTPQSRAEKKYGNHANHQQDQADHSVPPRRIELRFQP
jgi:hypothetical protein